MAPGLGSGQTRPPLPELVLSSDRCSCPGLASDLPGWRCSPTTAKSKVRGPVLSASPMSEALAETQLLRVRP